MKNCKSCKSCKFLLRVNIYKDRYPLTLLKSQYDYYCMKTVTLKQSKNNKDDKVDDRYNNNIWKLDYEYLNYKGIWANNEDNMPSVYLNSYCKYFKKRERGMDIRTLLVGAVYYEEEKVEEKNKHCLACGKELSKQNQRRIVTTEKDFNNSFIRKEYVTCGNIKCRHIRRNLIEFEKQLKDIERKCTCGGILIENYDSEIGKDFKNKGIKHWICKTCGNCVYEVRA